MNDTIKIVETDNALKAIGPYSQAITHNGLVFPSGQIPIDPVSGAMLEDDIEVQARQVFSNLKAVLEAAGTTLENALKVTVYLKDMNDFQRFNSVYAEAFGDARPARSTIQVARLPKDSRVEVDVVATTR